MTLSDVLVDEPSGKAYSSLCLMLIPAEEHLLPFVEHAGLPVEDLHTTLLYAGDSDQYVKRGIDMRQVISRIRPLLHPVSGTAGKVERFDGVTENHNAVVVLIEDNDEIMALHKDVLEALKDIGVTWQSQFAYKPHMTLGYIDVDDHVDPHSVPDFRDHQIVYDRLRVSYDGEQVDLWFHQSSLPAIKSRAALVMETKDLYMGADGLRPKVSAARTIMGRGKRGSVRNRAATIVRNSTTTKKEKP